MIYCGYGLSCTCTIMLVPRVSGRGSPPQPPPPPGPPPSGKLCWSHRREDRTGGSLQKLHSAFQVLKMPVSTLATFTDAISQAGTSNGFPGYNVLSLAVAQPSPSPGPSPSPASSPPVSINPNSPSPSPSPSPKDVIPNPSPKSSPVGPLPTEESNATMIIVIIVVVVVVLVIAAGLTVAYCMYKKSGPAGGLLDSRPSSTSSLKSGGSVITVKSQGMWVVSRTMGIDWGNCLSFTSTSQWFDLG